MDQEIKDTIKTGRNIFFRVAFWLLMFSASFAILGLAIRSCKKATHIEDATLRYEEYQEIFNTCVKINTDLCNMKTIPDDDPMFEQFSKNQRVLQLQTNLNRWVEEYNAKSNMWGRSLWKSSALPYQLSVNQFNCN